MRKILLLLVAVLSIFTGIAQTNDAEKNAALQLVSVNRSSIGLSADDLNNLMVSSSYLDKTTGIRYVYLQQTWKDIPVYNQLQVLTFRNNKLLSNAGGRIPFIEQKVNMFSGSPAVSAESAVRAAITDRKLTSPQLLVALNSKDNGRLIEFTNAGVSRENITAQLMWYPDQNGGKQVTLSWQVYIIPKTTPDYWLVRIDATNSS